MTESELTHEELILALRRARAIIDYLERGADVVSSERVADGIKALDATLARASK